MKLYVIVQEGRKSFAMYPMQANDVWKFLNDLQ